MKRVFGNERLWADENHVVESPVIIIGGAEKYENRLAGSCQKGP